MKERAPDLTRLLTLVGLVSVAVYIFTIQYGFVWDDTALIAWNASIRSPRFVAEDVRLDFGILVVVSGLLHAGLGEELHATAS